MANQNSQQLQMVWDEILIPISIPPNTQGKLVQLLAEFLCDYWEKNLDKNTDQTKKGER